MTDGSSVHLRLGHVRSMKFNLFLLQYRLAMTVSKKLLKLIPLSTPLNGGYNAWKRMKYSVKLMCRQVTNCTQGVDFQYTATVCAMSAAGKRSSTCPKHFFQRVDATRRQPGTMISDPDMRACAMAPFSNFCGGLHVVRPRQSAICSGLRRPISGARVHEVWRCGGICRSRPP